MEEHNKGSEKGKLGKQEQQDGANEKQRETREEKTNRNGRLKEVNRQQIDKDRYRKTEREKGDSINDVDRY